MLFISETKQIGNSTLLFRGCFSALGDLDITAAEITRCLGALEIRRLLPKVARPESFGHTFCIQSRIPSAVCVRFGWSQIFINPKTKDPVFDQGEFRLIVQHGCPATTNKAPSALQKSVRKPLGIHLTKHTCLSPHPVSCSRQYIPRHVPHLLCVSPLHSSHCCPHSKQCLRAPIYQ